MKLLLLLAIVSASLVFAQAAVDYGHIAITAQQQERDGAVVRCRGQVEIATGNTLLRADEADFHSDTGEIELRGSVLVKLLPPAPRPRAGGEPLKSPLQMEPRFRRSLSLPEVWK